MKNGNKNGKFRWQNEKCCEWRWTVVTILRRSLLFIDEKNVVTRLRTAKFWKMCANAAHLPWLQKPLLLATLLMSLRRNGSPISCGTTPTNFIPGVSRDQSTGSRPWLIRSSKRASRLGASMGLAEVNSTAGVAGASTSGGVVTVFKWARASLSLFFTDFLR